MKFIGEEKELLIYGIDYGTDERATGCDHYGFVQTQADPFRVARCTRCGEDLYAEDIERFRRWMEQERPA